MYYRFSLPALMLTQRSVTRNKFVHIIQRGMSVSSVPRQEVKNEDNSGVCDIGTPIEDSDLIEPTV